MAAGPADVGVSAFPDVPGEEFLGALGLVFALGLVAGGVLLGAYAYATRRFAHSNRVDLSLALLAACCIAAFAALVSSVAAAELMPRLDRRLLVSLPLVDPGFVTVARVVTFAGGIYTMSFALLLFFGVLAALRRWSEAYVVLVSGTGLVGLLSLLHWLVPRAAPVVGVVPFLPMSSFPSDTAALVTAFLLLAGWVSAKGPSRSPARVARLWMLGLAALAVCVLSIVAGAAWLSDVLAGVVLAVAVVGVSILVHDVAHKTRDVQVPSGKAPLVLAVWRRLVAAASARLGWLFGSTAILWGLIALGIILRIATLWTYHLGIDANRYAVMGQSWALDRTFTMPWGDVYSPGGGSEPSHHYPPVYPIFLSWFYTAFGFSKMTTHVASLASALLAMLVTYACSRNLYGHVRGLVATAVVAVSPILLLTTGRGYGENLVLALFVGTMWAILKSLERPGYIIAAGLLAGLGYLAKSSMGYFFIIAGVGGLVWRLRWRGWKVLRDPYYVSAIGIFGFLVGAWALRNFRLFGTFDTSAHLTAAYAAALADPTSWALRSLLALVFLFGMGYLLFMALLPWLPRLAAAPKLATEHDSGLWLAMGLPLVLVSAIDGALWLYERNFQFFNLRYVSFVIIPAVWLLSRHVSIGMKSVRAAAATSLALLLVGCAAFSTPIETPSTQAAESLEGRIEDGQTLAFVGLTDVYTYYFDATANGTRRVDIVMVDANDAENVTADWVLTATNVGGLPASYRLDGVYGNPDGPAAWAVRVWRHDPMVQAGATDGAMSADFASSA